MDYESMMMGLINSRLAKQVSNAASATERESRGVPNSTRRAFESRMRSDAAVARMAAQNMEDGASMVNVAQTYTTSIKSQLQSIQEILIDCTDTQSFSSQHFADAWEGVQKHIAEIVRLAENAEFNGMKLMDGTAGNGQGSTGSGGTVQMQAGNSARNQHFMNLLDGSGTVLSANSMDLRALTTDLQFNDSATAQAALDKVEKYIDRMQSLEAQYSYDFKSLDNLRLLFEEQSDIFEEAAHRSEQSTTTTTPTSRSAILSELLSSSDAPILSGTT